jgi:hypothetical protein
MTTTPSDNAPPAEPTLPPSRPSLRKWQIVRLDPKRPLLLAGPVAVFVGVLIGVLNGWAFPESPGLSALFGFIAALAVLLSVLLGVGLFNLICDRMNKGLTVWVRDPAGLSATAPLPAAEAVEPTSTDTVPAEHPPTEPEPVPEDEEPQWFEQPYPDPDEELGRSSAAEDEEPRDDRIQHWSQQPYPDPDASGTMSDRPDAPEPAREETP